MIRILHVFQEMSNGGIEHFVMNYYRNIDRTKYQFDFLVSVDTKGYFDDEIIKLGGKIHHAYPFKKNPLKNYKNIVQIIKDNGYDIVHRHTGSAFGYYELKAAKTAGARHLILHAHNNQAGNILIHFLSKLFFKVDCEKLACSKEAGEWLFGKNSEFYIFPNSIDCKIFKYNNKIRSRIRNELHIENMFVVGHIGRFEKQKNHDFLIDIFEQVVKINPNSLLLCVGEGSLKKTIEDKVEKLHLSENVMFLGTRTDIPQLLCGMDCFVLPSLYEGLPFVLIESQAMGLKNIVSSNVPVDCNITNEITFLSLSSSAKKWAEKIIDSHSLYDRSEYSDIIKQHGYDLDSSTLKLCELYTKLLEN